jgi:hypothetical protein
VVEAKWVDAGAVEVVDEEGGDENEGLRVGGVEAVGEDEEDLKVILRILIFAGVGILTKKSWVNRKSKNRKNRWSRREG